MDDISSTPFGYIKVFNFRTVTVIIRGIQNFYGILRVNLVCIC